jgi:hypothetical protein
MSPLGESDTKPVMKFDFDPNAAPGVVKLLAVMKTFADSKRDPGMAVICAVMREALTGEEIAGLPRAPEVPGEGNVSDDPVIAWSAFLLWASLRGDL